VLLRYIEPQGQYEGGSRNILSVDTLAPYASHFTPSIMKNTTPYAHCHSRVKCTSGGLTIGCCGFKLFHNFSMFNVDQGRQIKL